MDRKFLVAAGLLIGLCIPLGAVYGQDNSVTTSTTSGAVQSEDEQTVQWYKTEQIIGRTDFGDFVVGPGRAEITVEPGQTVTRELLVTNRVSEERTFKLEIVDVAGTSDGSAALQLIEGERGPYSVLDYVSFQEDTVTLGLGERARIPYTVTVPADAEPGGFYGSILVSTVRAGARDTVNTAPQNPIIARVGSHVFITVNGEQQVGGSTIDLTTIPSAAWYSSGPLTFGIAYENTGSVHVNPYGQLSITNLLGQEVGYIELEPWFVLPQSIRTREVDWDRDFLFGRYTAEATINRGYDDILDTVEVTFWVLPWQILLLVFGSVALVVFVIRLFVRTFEFKRRS